MGKTILIVEDDPQGMKLVRELLQKRGYRILEATDSRQGVELARAKKPSLVLMDIGLPVMGGLEVTKVLKEDGATNDITIIALTAYAMNGDWKKALKDGCDDYLSKPIDVPLFLEKVAQYIEPHR